MPFKNRRKERFIFYTEDENLKKILESQNEVSAFVESELLKIINGDYVDRKEAEDSKTLDNEYKRLRNEGIEIKNKINQHTLDYIENFGSRPSKAGEKAIKESYKHLKAKRVNEEVQRKYVINEEKSDSQPFKALCKICEALFEGTERHEVTDDVCWHIEEIHKQRPEIVVSKN